MFRIHIAELHIHIEGLGAEQLADIKRSLHQLKEIAMANQAETAQQLRDVNTKLTKAAAEIVAKVAALEAAVTAAGASTPELDAAVADLVTAAEALDSLNPDAPVDPAPV